MSNADWWAKKLGNTQPQAPAYRPDPTPAMPPSQLPMSSFPAIQPPATTAPSARQTDVCPNCRSANYMTAQGGAARCFDCGYPLEQSGSRYGSLAGAHVEGATKAATGNDVVSNWNPQGIIGRIDG